MNFTDVERVLQTCMVGIDDSDADRLEKRERRQQAQRDLEALLQSIEPSTEEAYRLALIFSRAGPGDLSPLRLALDLARRAHGNGHPEAGLLVAQCVDRLLYFEHKPQRYGTVRPTIAGEARLPALDPSVTDEERAQLGLPPATQLRREVEQANRNSARQVAEHGLPEGANLRRVYRPLRPAALAEVLGERSEAVWRDGDDVVFCWHGSASAVTVWFGIEMAMEQLEGSDLWVLVVRIGDLDRAAFSYRFVPADGHEPRQWAERSGTWRGPEAPPAPAVAQTLVGELRTVELDSAALDERRRIHVYLPPGQDRRNVPGVLYATDGRVSAELIEPLVLAGRIPPIVSVGVTFGDDPGADRRAEEYLPGFQPERFEAHRRFFVEEVPARTEAELGVLPSREDRAIFGVSNGAAFAASMGVRHPERFGTVIAFSLGITGAAPAWAPGEAPRHYLCAGSLEEGFERGTRRWAEVVRAGGAEVLHRTWVSGHDPAMWDGELPKALEWAYGSGRRLASTASKCGPGGG